MKTLAIKKELHHVIDIIEDKDFLKAIYVLLNEKSKEYDYELSDSEKKELDDLSSLHKLGKSKSYSMVEVRKYAHSKLKK
jgi:hypothetical protein